MPTGLCALKPISLEQWLLALLLLTVGQTLNAGAYAAIGKVGIYYGARLGHKLLWVSSFPYNLTAHPQYVGSVMTLWAAIVLFYNMLPQPAAWFVGAYWSALYLVTALQEQLT